MINCDIKEGYVNFVKKLDFKYFVTFTFNRKFAKEDCLQQVGFILKELNKYYFGKKHKVGNLITLYVDEEQGLRGSNEAHIHILIKDDAKLHDTKKICLKDRLLHLISRVGSQRSLKLHEHLKYNNNNKKLQLYSYKKSMGSVKHFDFKEVYNEERLANYIFKSFDYNNSSDFIHI